jgi:alkanesulfonate monooxygenase SsuD/methylene tetrahydromethanopterin reductase-like flavin-dependent oxidoreductase (luciferase family)
MDVGIGLPATIRGVQGGQLLEWARIWAGEGGIGPELPGGGPPVLIGGRVDAAFERAARHAGWAMGGGTPAQFSEGAAKLRAAWEAAGREGEARTLALAYFALGDGAREAADRYLLDYYGFMGEAASMVAGSAATDAGTVAGYVQAFRQAGCDELVLFPCDPDPDQIDLLADAVLT